ncbi:uncharacterized protein DS421_12g369050 [Arachis hypogaea]|nr:uncharacterized protein DS421_12g369050 [Arachis hypogaea]
MNVKGSLIGKLSISAILAAYMLKVKNGKGSSPEEFQIVQNYCFLHISIQY